MLRKFIKGLTEKLPFDFSLSQKYDRETSNVIARVCKANSSAIDVGCHRGAILDLILEQAPQAKHFAFEPLPNFYQELKTKYAHSNCQISNVAVSDTTGTSTFNYVVSNPSYSGLKKRGYDRPQEEEKEITVTVDTLDNLIPETERIDFIKIDVEGAEILVLRGARETILRNQPIVVFEFGIGGSDFYGTKPEDVFNYFQEINYKVSLMENWLKQKPALSLRALSKEYESKRNCYFIAYPA